MRQLADLGDVLRAEAERDENAERKPLTAVEALRMQARLLPAAKAAAKERQREGGRLGGAAQAPPTVGGASKPKNRGEIAKERTARATGWSAESLRRVEVMTKAAAAEPERYGHFSARLEHAATPQAVAAAWQDYGAVANAGNTAAATEDVARAAARKRERPGETLWSAALGSLEHLATLDISAMRGEADYRAVVTSCARQLKRCRDLFTLIEEEAADHNSHLDPITEGADHETVDAFDRP